MDNGLEELDPLKLGALAAAPLTQEAHASLLAQQKIQEALNSPVAMRERFFEMFLKHADGPHASGIMPVQIRATNSLLELVRSTTHALWVAHEAEIKAANPTLWDEELARGWLLADALARLPKSEAAARTVGKRAATQIGSVNGKVGKATKVARKTPQEGRDTAVKEAVEAVWAGEYTTLFAGLEDALTRTVFQPGRRPAVATTAPPLMSPPPPRPPPLTTAAPALCATPATCPVVEAPAAPAAALPDEAFRARESEASLATTEEDHEDLVVDLLAEAAAELAQEVALLKQQLEAARKEAAAERQLQAEKDGQAVHLKYELAMANARLKEANERLEAKEADYKCRSCMKFRGWVWCEMTQAYLPSRV